MTLICILTLKKTLQPLKAVNGESHFPKTANTFVLDLEGLTSSWNERGPTWRYYNAIFLLLITHSIIERCEPYWLSVTDTVI